MATRKPRTINADEVFLSEIQIREQQAEQATLQQQLATTQPQMPDYDEGDIDDMTALNSVLSEIGAGTEASKGFITVFRERILNGTKSEIYISKFSVTDYANANLLEHLQNNYGGGRYHIRVYAPSASRGVSLYANKWIDIDGEPKVAAQAIGAIVTPQIDLSPVLTAINQSQQQFEKLLGAIVSTQPKQKTTEEFLREMTMMKELFAPAVAAPTVQPVTQIMDAMKLGMEMAAMNQGGDGNSAWAIKAMDMFGKPIIDAVMAGNLKPSAPAAHRPTPIPTQNALPAPAPATTAQSIEEESDMSLMIKIYFKKLANAAAQNHPVEDYADEILNMLPESELPEFDTLLRAPDWQTKLAAQSNAVNEHPVWFTSLRNMIIEFRDADIAEANHEVEPQESAAYVPALTTVPKADSVVTHENDSSGTPAQNSNPGGTS